MCDIVVLYVLQKKYFYREKKYLMVDTDTDSEPESEQVIQNVLLNPLTSRSDEQVTSPYNI